MNDLVLDASFVNKPSVYLQTDVSRSHYELYVTIQLQAGEKAVAEQEYQGALLVGITYEIVPDDAAGIPRVFQKKIYFDVTEGVASLNPQVAVSVQARDGSKSKVIVHHADADIPGTGKPL